MIVNKKCAVWLGIVAGLAVPAVAQSPRPATAAQNAAPAMVSEPVIQNIFDNAFQHRRPAVMQWSTQQALALLTYIQGLGAEGLNPADYRTSDLRSAIAEGPGDKLNAVASEQFSWVVEDLRDGRTPMSARTQWFVIDPDAEQSPTNKVMEDALATNAIAATLNGLLPTNPDYAALKAELAKTPATNRARRTLLQVNMERWRWLPRDLGVQYLMTNVPEYQLRLNVNNKIIRTYRTVVGKPGRTATPQLAEQVSGVVFNPTWTVPQSIVKGEGLGARVMANPAWARANGYKGSRAENGFITVVQQPGPNNSLGLMKLDMPNPHAIFLHDTPSRHLFNQEHRALSHGCIRTERALELAMTIAILGQGATREEAVQISTAGDYKIVPVVKKMPVYITYFTMGTDIEGTMRSFNDIYSRDSAVVASLAAPRVANRSRIPTEEAVEIIDDLKLT